MKLSGRVQLGLIQLGAPFVQLGYPGLAPVGPSPIRPVSAQVPVMYGRIQLGGPFVQLGRPGIATSLLPVFDLADPRKGTIVL